MSKKIKILLLGVCSVLAVFALFIVINTQNESEQLVVKNAVQATSNIKPKEVKVPTGDTTADRDLQQGAQQPINTEQPLSPAQHEIIKQRGAALALQMNDLAQQLDKNLDAPEQRKRIQAEYLKLTQEYNQLAIQLVNAERAKGAAAE